MSLAVGDGHESRGPPISSSDLRPPAAPAKPAAPADAAALLLQDGATHLDVHQHFRLVVHDSLTQRLRLRAQIKELGKELTELGAAEISLADLRVGTPATKKVVLPLAGRASPALFHLQVRYQHI